MTCLLALLFIPTEYYQNMSTGIEVMEGTRMRLRTDAMLIALSPEPIGRGIKKVKIAGLIVSVCELNIIKKPAHAYNSNWDVFYFPAKYYQGIKAMERTRIRLQYFCFRGDNYIMNNVRVVSLARDMPTGPPLHQMISNSMKVMACTRFRLQGR